MPHAFKRNSTIKVDPTLVCHLLVATVVVLAGVVALIGLGVHADFLQSAGLVPSGANNWFSSLDTAVKNADGEMTLAAIATTPIAASVIGWSHYAGSQQSHKHAGRALAGLVVLLAVAPHIAS